MKTYLKSTLLVLTLWVSAMQPVWARDLVIALSPYNEAAKLEAETKEVIDAALDALQPGDTAHFVNAATLELIATFRIPDQEGFDGKRAKANVNRGALRDLKDFFTAPQDGPVGQIDPVGLFRFVGDNFPAVKPSALVIIGSPLYRNASVPDLAMDGGRFPNDSHVLESPSNSPYGTRGHERALKGYAVFWTFNDPAWVINPQHEEAVTRLWTGTIGVMGGVPVALEDDLATVLHRLKAGDTGSLPIPVLKAEGNPAMIRLLRVSIEDVDIFTLELSERRLPEDRLRNLEEVEIGIVWENCDACDLDLHVRPAPGARLIFFGNSETPEGRLLKDFTSSPGVQNTFETVELNAAVDAHDLLVAINMFSGRASEGFVTGRIRFRIGDEAWEAPFTIEAPLGNAGYERETVMLEDRVPNNQWVIIDPVDVMTGG